MEKLASVKVAQILGIVALYGGLIVMFGWFVDIDILKRVHPDWVTMKFTAAFSFVVAGLILYSSTMTISRESELSDIILPILSTVIIFIMGVLLVSVIIGTKTGIEDLFVRELPDAVHTTVPGRPSIGTMLAFLLVAAVGFIAGKSHVGVRNFISISGGLMAGIGVVALIGYLLNNPLFYLDIPGLSSAMAIHSAILFVLLGLGFIALGVSPVVERSSYFSQRQ